MRLVDSSPVDILRREVLGRSNKAASNCYPAQRAGALGLGHVMDERLHATSIATTLKDGQSASLHPQGPSLPVKVLFDEEDKRCPDYN